MGKKRKGMKGTGRKGILWKVYQTNLRSLHYFLIIVFPGYV